MSYLEKDFQTDFNKWCKHLFPVPAAFELKCTKKNSLSFSAVKSHQESALYAVKHGVFVFKIPDLGNQNPFDSFMFKQSAAFVVIMFNAKSNDFVLIDIDTWLTEKQSSQRKSLTLERALEIGHGCSLSGFSQLPRNLRTNLLGALSSNTSVYQLQS